MCRSVRQSPAAPIFTITSSGPRIFGSSISSTFRASWYLCSRAAFMQRLPPPNSEPATDRGTCRRWSPATARSATPSAGTARSRSTGVPSPVTNAGASSDASMPSAAPQLAQRSASGPDSSPETRRRRIVDDASSRPWRATSALRWNSARSASSSPRVSPGNASENPPPRVDRGVDLRRPCSDPRARSATCPNPGRGRPRRGRRRPSGTRSSARTAASGAAAAPTRRRRRSRRRSRRSRAW